ALAPRPVRTVEVDGTDIAAGLHALAVGFTLLQVDLVGEVDRVLGAGADAGVAARAYLEIDGIALLPGDVERSEVPLDRDRPARPHRVAAVGRQLAGARGRDEHAHAQLPGELLRPGDRSVRGADDQQLAPGLVRHAGDGLGLGKVGERE